MDLFRREGPGAGCAFRRRRPRGSRGAAADRLRLNAQRAQAEREVDLARAERDGLPGLDRHQQVAPLVDPAGGTGTAPLIGSPLPVDLTAGQCVPAAELLEHPLLRRLDPFSERGVERRPHPLRRGSPAERGRRPAEIGGKLVRPDREVDPDPDHRPVRWPGLDQDPGQLALVEPDVVGPLDLTRDIRFSLARRADRQWHRQRQQHVGEVERPEDGRVEQRRIGRCRPSAVATPAARRLLGGGDDGPGGSTGHGQLLGPQVGRVGLVVVVVGLAEAGALRAVARSTAPARARPRRRRGRRAPRSRHRG